jgi:hypothetical protein
MSLAPSAESLAAAPLLLPGGGVAVTFQAID